jgi:FlaA1/EpsC-like NDP-sugar epimerase/UDP-N-acetylmuramyl pentapeptide phosphotransferase/UDP-N-acetylglucosamine-1-phosphate transferase
LTALTQLSLVATAFTTSCFAVKWVITVLRRLEVVDVPNERSSHNSPTTTGGGLGIIAGLAAGIAMGGVLSLPSPKLSLLMAASLMMIVGLLDDWIKGGVAIPWRLAAQCLSAMIVVSGYGGLPIPLADSAPSAVALVEAIVAMIWIVGVVNLYNFLDGIDGFAGTQGIIAGLGVALLGPSDTLVVIGLSLAGACAGFLVYNWQPARVFMGDVGSTTVGLLVAAVPFHYEVQARWQAVSIVILLLWFFLSDGAFTLLRRVAQGERIWRAHRTHLYQRLTVTGLSHAQVVLRIGASSALLALLTVILTTLSIPQRHWILLSIATVMFAAYWRWTIMRESGAVQASIAAQRDVEATAPGAAVNKFLFSYRRFAIAAYHIIIIIIAQIVAFWLRFDFDVPESHEFLIYRGLLIAVAMKMIVFSLMGMHHGWWRYVGLADLNKLFIANLAGSALFVSAAIVIVGARFPRSIFFIDFLLCVFAAAAGRFVVHFWSQSRSLGGSVGKRRRVLIYGAGSAAVTIVREVRMNPSLGYDVVGYIDDDLRKQDAVIMGVPVLGLGRDAGKIVSRCQRGSKGKIDEIVIAMPSASPAQMRKAILNCQATGTPCKTIPSVGQLLTGQVLSAQLRQVSFEELLGRAPVRIEEKGVRDDIAGHRVLVTGGAGSIGSELCRQIAAFGPRRLVVFDQAESELYDVDRELRSRFAGVDIVCMVGDIRDPARLNDVIAKHGVDSIFHAAAYKHVPMMESYPLEAIRNNVFGTWNLVQAAYRYPVSSFVMISSDKAVNPTSIMGVTKRVTELMVSAMPQDRTKFVSVRFGNVLGSRGSAVPIFQAQIEAGGPVTITHPEMRRYFMTIPEAVQLVLLASTMGKGSEIFVLDMGDPVRIVDLARNLIRLAGRVPDQDIELRFVGIRPGEKLYEELGMENENISPTSHQKIRIFNAVRPEIAVVEQWLDELGEILNARDDFGAVQHLNRLVPEYKPDRLWLASPQTTEIGAAASA